MIGLDEIRLIAEAMIENDTKERNKILSLVEKVELKATRKLLF